MSVSAPPATTPRAARRAVMAVFFVNGVAGASWFTRIPAVQQRLALSPGALGVVLLGLTIGSLLSMTLAGGLVARFGSRPVTTAGTFAYCAALPLPALAPSAPLLLLALIAFGVGNGTMDVSMNAQAVAVERRFGRPIMSSFHGLFSVGGIVGAAAGGLIAGRGIDPLPHLAGVAVALLALSAVATRWLLPADVEAVRHGPMFARPSRALAGLGAIAFCTLLSEGAMSDWSAVYLRSGLGTGAGFAAAGYAVFSLAMAAGRLAGDWVGARLGPVGLVRAGGLISAAGLGLGLALGRPLATLVGFGCVGLGMSTIFPLALSAAGRFPGIAPGPAIAALATIGYTGFLAGPPLIGFVAEALTLRAALGVVALLGLAIALLAGAVGRAERHRAPTGG